MAGAAEADSPQRLAQSIEEYLAGHPAAAELEDGRVLFDMRAAHHAVSEQHGRCVLQLWGVERNLVRTAADLRGRAQCLGLTTRHMGMAQPQTLELVSTSDRRTPTARDAGRRNYQRLLERTLARSLNDSRWTECGRPWTWNTALGRSMYVARDHGTLPARVGRRLSKAPRRRNEVGNAYQAAAHSRRSRTSSSTRFRSESQANMMRAAPPMNV